MAKATVTFIGANNIFKGLIDKTYENVFLISNAQNALVLKIEDQDEYFINPNYKISFTEKGIVIEGYLLIAHNLGMVSILIKKYE
jgi:hypothetical protein